MNNMISKKELEKMGFKPHQAASIIRQAKFNLVSNGFSYYNNKRLGVVPRQVVEEIIGIPPSQEE
ncbi:DUF3173 domain-containing protein [Enterococcus sp. PF-2]|uniref:DUF3173 domain-containing protein n=2 Tax=Enterococcus TaxID=1350 RepID=A0ABV3MAB9_9ENTE|nr:MULTISPECIES: DUF3173 domain-containing protein [Enterococcus]AMG49381.1 DUF3173 domain-containing protein [Enterococcus gallinarum]MDB1715988.1 DUF3173 domain-containing protein [Enterococcus casseliflavus]TPE08392.1 DUF3173 domain-containing protein [Enterococcus sp. PF-3]TPE29483.1 DUF3173 domain-containing protein [Enterococcus sp. PF-2]